MSWDDCIQHYNVFYCCRLYPDSRLGGVWNSFTNTAFSTETTACGAVMYYEEQAEKPRGRWVKNTKVRGVEGGKGDEAWCGKNGLITTTLRIAVPLSASRDVQHCGASDSERGR